MSSKRTEFFIVPNCIRAYLPRGWNNTYCSSEWAISKPWFNYFNMLEKFLIQYNTLPLIYYDNNKRRLSFAERQTIQDKCNILSLLINKTFGFQKPYERLEIDLFETINIETSSFMPYRIPHSTIDRRLPELGEGRKNENGVFIEGDKLLSRFKLADSKIGFFAPRPKRILDCIAPKLLKLSVDSRFNNPDKPELEDFHSTVKWPSKKLRKIQDLYIKLNSDNKYFLNPLSDYIDAFNGKVFKNNDDAIFNIGIVGRSIFDRLNSSDGSEKDIYDNEAA